MQGIESLHNHTTHSDGLLSHWELYSLASTLGYSVIAFTDHDALPDAEALAFLESVRSEPLKWITGIEMTARLPEDMGGKSVANFHIIGLFTDPHNAALREHCVLAQAAREQRMGTTVDNLKRLGFRITQEDCLAESGGESVGRPHIVRALARHPENTFVFEKLRIDMAEEAKTNPKVAEKYKQLIDGRPEQYPYLLVLSPNSYRPAFAGYSYIPTMDEAVTLIRGAGGIASIAHYFSISEFISAEKLKEFARSGRIDALEVVCDNRFAGEPERERILKEREITRMIVREEGILATGGADAHTRADVEYYASNKEYSGEAQGFTAKLLASGKINSRHSSFS